MKRIILVVLLLAVASPSFAGGKKCGHTHKKAAPCWSLTDALRDGFALTGGFRWESERVVRYGRPHTEVKDPFYIGARITLPLNPRLDVEGAWNRDFTKDPDWNAHVQLNSYIFRK